MRVRRSLSAVSKPTFARKYALETSRRDLRNALLCTVLDFFGPFSKLKFLFKIVEHLPKFAKFAKIAGLVKISLDFGQHLPEFVGICWNLLNFAI